MEVASSPNKQKPLTRQLQTRHFSFSAHRNAGERHRLGPRARGASKKKKEPRKKNLAKSEKRPTDFPSFFFLGAPFKRYARRASAVDMPPQMGTRSPQLAAGSSFPS
jgi:hypothetical protein